MASGKFRSLIQPAEIGAVGDAPIYACRAWVNFNGTGTVAIRASGNVSSITDNGVGLYTVNFTTAMPDGNYTIQMTTDLIVSLAASEGINASYTETVNSFQVATWYNGAANDRSRVSIAIFR